MKKTWVKPEVEVLDVKMTMLGKQGRKLDASFEEGTDFGDLTFS